MTFGGCPWGRARQKKFGMIDRLQESFYTFAYWEGGVLKSGTVKPTQIGTWD